MDVSVIIVNWNSGSFLTDCLSTLVAHIGDILWEIFIVDNASIDESLKIIRQLDIPIRLLTNQENRGFAAANNQALVLARGRYVLFLNADTIVTRGTVQELVDFVDGDPSVGIVGGQLFTPTGDLQRWAKGSEFSLGAAINHYFFLSDLFGRPGLSDPTLSSRPREMGWVSGCCLLARREMIDQIGPLDEVYFMYAEDVDLCRRAWQHGWRVIHHPGLSITHFQGGSLKQQRAVRIAQMPLTMLDNFFASIAPRWQIIPFRLVMFLGLALRAGISGLVYLRRRDPRAAGAWYAGCDYAMLAGRILLGRTTRVTEVPPQASCSIS
ncbi:MAG: glycosyltransferase family 2 protein [Ardenticatenaceae bacterium]|nr:glycosyltransferase family 2 protein [Ardenticatenaceae bacterium]